MARALLIGTSYSISKYCGIEVRQWLAMREVDLRLLMLSSAALWNRGTITPEDRKGRRQRERDREEGVREEMEDEMEGLHRNFY